MARGLNKVMIIGNLGADPETRHTPSGIAITNIRVATSEVWKDKDSGEKKEKTEWHRIVLFNKLADIAKQYLRKGSKVYIEGSLKTTRWQDKDGSDRYSTDIVASEMQLLDAKKSDGPPAEAYQNDADKYKSGAQSAPEFSDDIIPF